MTLGTPNAPTISHRATVLFLVIIALGNAGLSVANTFTRAPWWDEGIYVSPAYNLAIHGVFGTTVQHPRGLPHDVELPQYDRYTYWALPGYVLTLAGWIRLFGASIFTTRLLSVLFGEVLVIAWYLIVRRLTESRLAGVMAALFVAADFSVITAASTQRMDCMTAALGACGLAAYLGLRGKRFSLALLAGNTLTAAALLCHPVGAVHVIALAILVVCLDRRSIAWKSLPIMALPYVVFLAGWGIYVLQAPGVAAGQMRAQAGHRVGGVSSPVQSLLTDAAGRYWTYFYVLERGINKLKALMLAEYILGLGLALGIPSLRKRRGVGVLVAMAVSAFVALAVLDGMKSPHYMIVTCTVFAALWGVVVSSGLGRRSTAALALLAGSGFLLVHVAAAVQRARNDTYHKQFLPAIEFLEANGAGGTDRIVGPAELWFGLGPRAALLDDMRLGYYSGWHPRWIVTDEFYETAFEGFRVDEPVVWRHVQDVLGHYDKVYSNRILTVYCVHGEHLLRPAPPALP